MSDRRPTPPSDQGLTAWKKAVTTMMKMPDVSSPSPGPSLHLNLAECYRKLGDLHGAPPPMSRVARGSVAQHRLHVAGSGVRCVSDAHLTNCAQASLYVSHEFGA